MDSCPMDGRISQLETSVERLVKVVEGNGQAGLLQKFTEFSAAFKGGDQERRRQHRQNQARLNLIIAALIALAAYIAIIQTQAAHKSLLDPGKIFHSLNAPEVAKQQLSTVPNTR